MIPEVRLADLSDDEFTYLTERVLIAPSLWPFTAVAGAVGLDVAVEACRHRGDEHAPSEAIAKALATGSYFMLSLPPYEDIRALLLATRMACVVESARSKGDPVPPYKKLAARFGADLTGGLKAFRVLRSYVPTKNGGLVPSNPAEVVVQNARYVPSARRTAK